MFRRLFILLTLLSSLLLAATLTLWFRSRHGGNDTLSLRTARTYAVGPALKWVVVETHDGLVIALHKKIVPRVYPAAPPWRQDVPIAAPAGQASYDEPVTLNFATSRFRRTMDGREYAEYEAHVTPDYAQVPWFRWQGGAPSAYRTPAPGHPLLERLGVRRFAPDDRIIDREAYPGAYRSESFRLPFILPVIATLVLPLRWTPAVWRRLRARRRIRALRCPACGYDLQQTLWTCPECGRSRVPGEWRRARRNALSRTVERLSDRREWVPLAFRGAGCAAALVVGSAVLRSPAVAGAGALSAEGRHLRRELDRQRASVADEVERLRAAGDAAGANRVAEELRTAGGAANDERHLHVLSLERFGDAPAPAGHPSEQRPRGTATVHVTATDRPILLALCGQEPLLWDLRVAPGVRLEQILLEGYGRQHVTGVPAGVPVRDNTAYAGNSSGYVLIHYGEPAYRWETRQLLRQRTGVRVRTFQARRHYGAVPFVVGPESADWRVQSEMAGLRPLYLRAAALRRERTLREIGPLRFYAMWSEFRMPRLPYGMQAPHPVPARVPMFSRGSWCGSGGGYAVEWFLTEFDAVGPVLSTKRWVPTAQVGALVFDARTGERVDVGTNEVGSWDGIALDPRRRRLMIIPSNTDDVFTFDLDTRRRSSVGAIGTYRQQRTPLTYSEADDCFYALTAAIAQQDVMTCSITRLSPDGRAEWQVPLPERVSTPLLGTPQLAAAGKYLAIITPPIPDPIDPDAPLERRCVLFDPQTRSVVYSGPLTPHHGPPTAPAATAHATPPPAEPTNP